jgi:hypothetical protein
MVNYDWKHPEKFYFDVMEYFNCRINTTLTNYSCGFFNDNQNEIQNYLEKKTEDSFSDIKINILMNIDYNNENKWLLTYGYCEWLPMLFPLFLFNENNDNENENDNNNNNDYYHENYYYNKFPSAKEDILEKCKDYLFFNKNMRKICNSCNNNAVYNCEECDNLDFCEECEKTCKYEKLHMKKLNCSEKKNLCDVCGKKQSDYSNNDYYYLCSDCFIDNPHKNHKLTKIKNKSNLYDDKEMISILKKNFYYHFAIQILKRCHFINLWKNFEKNNVCQIFNCEYPIIVAYIELLKIKGKTLKELKNIEIEFSELFDKMIRKYFTSEFNQFDFFFRSSNNIVTFYSDENCNKFCHDGIKLIKNKKKILPKKENVDINFDNDFIDL